MNYTLLAADLFTSLVKVSNAPFQKEARDFSVGEMGVLACLNFRSNGVSAGELSEYLDVSTGRVAAALNTLEKKNMIRRSRGNTDKRKVIVHITDIGRAAVLKKQQQGILCISKMLQNLGEDDAREFARIMQKIISL